MPTFDHDQLRTIFKGLIELNPDKRTAELDRVCGDDVNLRAKLERLLIYHAHAEGFEPEDIVGIHAEGLQVGSYQLIRLLGKGSTGAVYLAERADQVFDKQVAIKLLDRC